VALEAQLAAITAADITARAGRMYADGVGSIWFSDRPRPPWLGIVPSVRLARPDGAAGLVVAGGLVKFGADAGWRGLWTAVEAPLAEFLGWVFTGRVVLHKPRTGFDYPLAPLALIWTAPRYVEAEARYEAEAKR
jgi:hypothetical protein